MPLLRVVYCRQNVTATAADNATVELLTQAGWLVDSVVGSLAAVDWADVAFLVLGHRTSNHPDAAALPTYPANMVSMSRYANQHLGLSTILEVLRSGTPMWQAAANHPLATQYEVSRPAATGSTILFTNLHPNALVIYARDDTISIVSETILNGRSYRQYADYRLDIAADDNKELFTRVAYGYGRYFSKPVSVPSGLGEPSGQGSNVRVGSASVGEALRPPVAVGGSAVEGLSIAVDSILGAPASMWATQGMVLYVTRFATLQSYEEALINALVAEGWGVTATSDSIAELDHSKYGVLIVGANHLTSSSPPDGSAYADFDIPVHITLCRWAARWAYGLATGLNWQTMGTFVRQPGVTDDRAVFDSITMTSAGSSYLTGFTSGTMLYRNATVGRGAIVARTLSGGRRALFFGYHQFQSADVSQVLDLFMHFAEIKTLAPVSYAISTGQMLGAPQASAGTAVIGSASDILGLLQPIAKIVSLTDKTKVALYAARSGVSPLYSYDQINVRALEYLGWSVHVVDAYYWDDAVDWDRYSTLFCGMSFWPHPDTGLHYRDALSQSLGSFPVRLVVFDKGDTEALGFLQAGQEVTLFQFSGGVSSDLIISESPEGHSPDLMREYYPDIQIPTQGASIRMDRIAAGVDVVGVFDYGTPYAIFSRLYTGEHLRLHTRFSRFFDPNEFGQLSDTRYFDRHHYLQQLALLFDDSYAHTMLWAETDTVVQAPALLGRANHTALIGTDQITALSPPLGYSKSFRRKAVYYRRVASSSYVWDITTIALLIEAGWDLEIDENSFPDRDWSEVGLYVIGPDGFNGTSYNLPAHWAAIQALEGIPIVSFCARSFVQMDRHPNVSTSTAQYSSVQATSFVRRIDGQHSWAMEESIAVQGYWRQRVFQEGLFAGLPAEDLWYLARTVYYAGHLDNRYGVFIASHRDSGTPFVFWGDHRMDLEGSEPVAYMFRVLARSLLTDTPPIGRLLTGPVLGPVQAVGVGDPDMVSYPVSIADGFGQIMCEGPYARSLAWSLGGLLQTPTSMPVYARPTMPKRLPVRFSIGHIGLNKNIFRVYEEEVGQPLFVQKSIPFELPDMDQYGAQHNWSPDGRYLAIPHGRWPHLTLVEFVNGTPVQYKQPFVGMGYSGSQYGRSAFWSPDGKYVLVTAQLSPAVRLFELVDGELVYRNVPGLTTGVSSTVVTCSWHPDGDCFSYATANTSGAQTRIFRSIDGVWSQIADPLDYYVQGGLGIWVSEWSPDGEFFYQVGYHGSNNTRAVEVYKWDKAAYSGARLTTPWNPVGNSFGLTRAAHWSPDGKYFVFAGEHSTQYAMRFRLYRVLPNGLNTEFTLLTSPPDSAMPSSSIIYVRWTRDGRYLIFGINEPPYVHIVDFSYYMPSADMWRT